GSRLHRAPTAAEPVSNKDHWEQVHTGRAGDTLSWYQPHAERSLALIKGRSCAKTACCRLKTTCSRCPSWHVPGR
ncbi:MAG: hypothetical protein WBM67_11930, partial [Sedimenticolaceae bacterium]